MTTQALPTPATPDTATDHDKPTLHCFCGACYPAPKKGDLALCGHVATGTTPVFEDIPPAEWPVCVVCEDLIPRGCSRCGAVIL